MPTLEELRKKIKKLEADNAKKQKAINLKAKSLSDFNKTQIEKRQLESRIKELSNPRSTAFKKNTLKGIKSAGRKSLPFLKNLKQRIDRNVSRM